MMVQAAAKVILPSIRSARTAIRGRADRRGYRAVYRRPWVSLMRNNSAPLRRCCPTHANSCGTCIASIPAAHLMLTLPRRMSFPRLGPCGRLPARHH